MKMSVQVDCTPQELRTFMGLPDMEPMQRAVMDEMQRRLLDAMDHMTPAAVMKDWLTPMTNAQQALFGAIGGGAMAAAKAARRTTASRRGSSTGAADETPSDPDD